MLAATFDNAFIRELPGDPTHGPGEREVPGTMYARVEPTPVARPRLLAHSAEMASRLGFCDDDLADPAFAEVFAGNALLPGMEPFASAYGGHQFGHWAGQLGDGRAISLGELVTEAGERWELQLKGAGRTPYSRGADGRAVLRSSVREFICSEAMHHLGVPTTRALCLAGSGEQIMRDMFYDGHPRLEPGAIVCRAAPSFIRFGHFELPAARGETELLRQLAEFVIARDFPHLGGNGETRLADWFGEICERTAEMVAHWMRVGFVHGVMNTDNMSVLGLSIDYGPYGWIEDFDPDWTPNTTDAHGRRYRFGQQPQVAYWNLGRLAGALAPLFADTVPLQAGLERYRHVFTGADARHTAAKLGLEALRDDDDALVRDLYRLLHASAIDMTRFFRHLGETAADTLSVEMLHRDSYDTSRVDAEAGAWQEWLRRYRVRVDADPLRMESRQTRMRAANPYYVPRNYLAQQAIDRADQGDVGGIDELLDVMRRPYEEQDGRESYAALRPEWALHRAGCSMLSCSS